MITSDDNGKYTCGDCGHTWQRRERYAWWPISVMWSWPWPHHSLFSVHGSQIGSDGIEQRVFARHVRIGPLVFSLGRAAARIDPSKEQGK